MLLSLAVADTRGYEHRPDLTLETERSPVRGVTTLGSQFGRGVVSFVTLLGGGACCRTLEAEATSLDGLAPVWRET